MKRLLSYLAILALLFVLKSQSSAAGDNDKSKKPAPVSQQVRDGSEARNNDNADEGDEDAAAIKAAHDNQPLTHYSGKGISVARHGLRGGAPVAPVIFDLSALPHVNPSSHPALAPEADNDVVDPRFPLQPPPVIEALKNVHMLPALDALRPPTTSAVSLGTGFNGTAQGSFIPTEPSAAAGPTWIFSTGNSEVITAHKDGTSETHTDGGAFYGVVTGTISDPVTMYDARHGRYIAVCFTTDAATYSQYYIAISQTNDPTGAWYKYEFDWTVDGTTPTGNFGDFQKVGISEDKIVVSSQQFNMSATAANRVYMYQKLRVFDRATMYSGGAATFVDFVNFPGQQFVTIPAKEYSSDSTIYLIADEVGGGSNLYTGTLAGSSNDPTLSFGTSVAVQTYGSVAGSYHSTGFIVAGSSAYRLADNDCRLNNFFYRNGYGHLVYHFGTIIGSDTVDAIKYVELNTQTTPWSVVRDEVYSAAATWFFYPDIAVDSAGSVFLGMGASSKTLDPSFYVTARRRSDANIESNVLAKAGAAVLGATYTRWGDYNSGDMDESASGPGGSTAWLAGQYTTSTTACGQWLQPMTLPYNQVSGQVLSDADGNAGTTGDRTALVGWSVTISQSGTVLQTATTDASGNYSFGYLEDGTYTVTALTTSGKRIPLTVITGSGGTSQTAVGDSAIQIQVAMSTSTGQTSSGNIIVLTPNKATISGNIFNDLNGNGTKDFGESNLSGWTVNLTGTSSASTTSDASGNFKFSGLNTGTYTVSDVIMSGYQATVPSSGSYTIVIAASDSQVTGINFGDNSSSTETWTGAGGNSLWSNANNWSPASVPTSANPVSIGTASTVNIDVAAQCASFTYGNTGAIVTMLSGQSLAVSGNFLMTSGVFNTQTSFPTVSGTTTLNGGTVGYTGASGSQTVAPLTYVNLSVYGGSTASLSGATTVSGRLLDSAGSTLNLNGQILTIGGSASLAVAAGATLQTGGSSLNGFASYSFNTSSTIQFNGGAENILALTYGNLSAGGSGTKTLLGNTSVAGTLSLGQQIATGSYTLTMGSASSVTQTTGYVYGAFAKQVSATGTVNWELGIPGTALPASLNVSAISGSGLITVTSNATSGAAAFMGDPTKSIGHYYNIQVASGITSLTATPSLDYSLAEFNALTGTGNDQTKLFLARWNGYAWVSLRTTSSVSSQAASSPGIVTLTSAINSFAQFGIFWGTTDAPLSQTGALTAVKWIGAGAGGSGTDFNTATNWNPSGVPTAQDSCVILLTANSNANINLSADITIGALTILQQATITSAQVFIDAQSHTFTINGKQWAVGRSNNTNAGVFLCVEANGSWVNNGNVYDSCSSTGLGLTPWYMQSGGANASFIFRGSKLTLGAGEFSYTGANLPDYFIFDGTGAQSVIDSASFSTYFASGTLIVGQSNNPHVTFSGSQSNLGTFGNITVNGSSILDLGSQPCNNAGSEGTLTINGTGKLRVSASNFPTGMAYFTYSGSDTEEYYGSSAQSVSATTYGNLEMTNGGTKTAAAGTTTIEGGLVINSGATFSGSSRTIVLDGNLVNNGTYTPGTSTFRLTGSVSQTIGGSTATTFATLVISKASGTASLLKNITCSANLTDSAGTFSLGSFTANRTASGGTLLVYAGATLDVGGTNGLPANYATHSFNATSTESFSGTNQTLSTAAETFGNLALSGSGTKTFPALATTIAGNFTTSGTGSATAAIGLTIDGYVSIGTGTTFNGATFTHNVKGNWTNNGTFTASTSTIDFNGTTADTIGGSNASSFINLTCNDAAGLTLSSNATVGGTLTLTSGTFRVGANTLTLNGPTIAGTPANLSAGSTAGLSFGGSSAGVTLPSIVSTLNALTINNANGVTLAGNLNIVSTLSVTSGNLITGADTVRLASGATVSEASGATVLGKLAATRNVTVTSGTATFGGIGADITLNGVATGATTVTRTTGTAETGNGHSGIKRFFDISAATDNGLNAGLTLHYDNGELNGQSKVGLEAFKSTNSGTTWTTLGGTLDTNARTIALTGLNDLSRWTISNSANSLAPASTVIITASAGSHGAIAPSGSVSVNYDSSQTFTITPAPGYTVATLVIDTNKTITGSTSYTFQSVTTTHSIAATFAPSGVITSVKSGNWGDTTVWNLLRFPQNSDSVVVSNGNVVTLDDPSGQTSAICGALNLLGTLSYDNTVGRYLTVRQTGGRSGNVYIAGTLTFNGAANDQMLVVEGNFASTGTLNNGSQGLGSEIEFIGTSARTLSSTAALRRLWLANGVQVTLVSALTVTSDIVLQRGTLVLGGDSVNAIGAAIDSASSSGYIVTNGNGRLARTVGTSATAFPVGTASGYNPVTLQTTSGSDTFYIGVIAGLNPSSASDQSALQLTYDLNKQNPSNDDGGISGSFQWNLSDEGSSFTRISGVSWRYNGTAWIEDGVVTGVTGSGPYTASLMGLTAMGHYTIANPNVLPVQLADLVGKALSTTSVGLEWSTASEKNLYGFYVERKPDSTYTFSTVSPLIQGNGTTLAKHTYSFEDTTVKAGTYDYRLRTVDLNGAVAYSDAVRVITQGVLGVKKAGPPLVFKLEQNFPNPFNPVTTIRFELPSKMTVTLNVVNVLGQEVARLVDRQILEAGDHDVQFNGATAPSGVYFYRLDAQGTKEHEVRTGKIVLIK